MVYWNGLHTQVALNKSDCCFFYWFMFDRSANGHNHPPSMADRLCESWGVQHLQRHLGLSTPQTAGGYTGQRWLNEVESISCCGYQLALAYICICINAHTITYLCIMVWSNPAKRSTTRVSLLCGLFEEDITCRFQPEYPGAGLVVEPSDGWADSQCNLHHLQTDCNFMERIG